MKESGTISAPQLSAALFLGAALIPFAFSRSILFGISGSNLPLAALLSAALEAACFLPVSAAAKRSEGKKLKCLFLVYFLFTAAYDLALFLTFLSNVVHSGVSPFLMAAGIAAVAGYGAQKGIEGAARAAAAVLVLIAVPLLLLAVSVFCRKGTLQQFGRPDAFETVKGGVSLFSRAAPLPALLFLRKNTRGNPAKPFFIGCLLSGLLLAAVVSAALSALGPYFYTQLFPIYQLAQIASFGPFSKMELPFLGVFLIGVTVELSVLLHLAAGCVFEIAAETPGRRRSVLIFFSLLVFSLGIFVCTFVSWQHVFFDETLLIAVSVFFCVLLPLYLAFPRGKTAAALLLALVLGLFPGCGAETNRTRTIVSSMLLSTAEEGIEVSLLCTDERGKSVYRESAESVTKAIDGIRAKSGKTPTLSRELLIFLDPDFAREGVFPICDFLTRCYEAAPNTQLFCCAGPAGEALEAMTEKAKTLGKSDTVRHTSSLEVVNAFLAQGGVFALPLIEKEGEDYKAEKTACFRKGTLCGELTSEETRTLLIVNGALKNTAVTFFDHEAGRTTLIVKNLNASKNRRDGCDLLLSCEADLSETEQTFYQTLDRAAYERFEAALSEQLCEKIKAAFEKAASLGCEKLFGFENVQGTPVIRVLANVNRMEEEANPVFQAFPVEPNPPRSGPESVSTSVILSAGIFSRIRNWQIRSFSRMTVSRVA